MGKPASKRLKARLLEALAAAGSLSHSEMLSLLGQDRDVRRARLELLAEGPVVAHGDGRSTRYSLAPGFVPGGESSSTPGGAPGSTPGSAGARARAPFLSNSSGSNEESGGGSGGRRRESPRGDESRMSAFLEWLGRVFREGMALLAQVFGEDEGRVSPREGPARVTPGRTTGDRDVKPAKATPVESIESVGPLSADERRGRDERFEQLEDEGDPVRNAPLMTDKIVREFRANPDLLQLRLRQADDRAQRRAVKKAEAERMAATRKVLDDEIARRRSERPPALAPSPPSLPARPGEDPLEAESRRKRLADAEARARGGVACR